MKQLIYLFWFTILTVWKFTLGTTDCGIQLADPYATFMFVEVNETIGVGTLLASYPTLNVDKVEKHYEYDSTSSLYINATINEENQEIEFHLIKDLAQYRIDPWLAFLEIDFDISCSSLSLRTYTFLLIIKDENLNAPKYLNFNREFPEQDFNITLPWPKNTKINTKPIQIQDTDYNPKYSNCNISCTGDDCDYFNITISLNDEHPGIPGHVYDVNIYFKNEVDYSTLVDIPEGHRFSIGLIANDSNFVSEELKVSVGVSEVVIGKKTKFPLGAVVGGGSAIAFLCLIFASAFGYQTIKNRAARNILRKLTEAEIREFLEGTAGFGAAVHKRSVDVNTPILSMPYNKQAFEISRDKLRIDETTILGTGFFGIVMKGSVIRQNQENLTVAVKAVKRNVGVLYFKALLSELKIMAFIGKHNNIVSLIGACTHNIRKREVYIALEFCKNGNLHNFLQTNRSNFVNMVRDGKLCGFDPMNSTYAYRRKSSTFEKISTLTLIKWSVQISRGMEYLSSLEVIHGDLATRNILLDEFRVAKIADFGLSRRLMDYSNDYYTKNSQGPLPWKWMAPESLRDMKFSKMSDIWSFGIILYEVFTLGRTPYPGLSWDPTFVDQLEKGLRMGKPKYASDEIFEIMTDCWTDNPHDRPGIFDIKRLLEGMASSLLVQTSDEGYFRVVGGAEKYVYIGPDENFEGSTRIDTSTEALWDC